MTTPMTECTLAQALAKRWLSENHPDKTFVDAHLDSNGAIVIRAHGREVFRPSNLRWHKVSEA